MRVRDVSFVVRSFGGKNNHVGFCSWGLTACTEVLLSEKKIVRKSDIKESMSKEQKVLGVVGYSDSSIMIEALRLK